VTTSAQLSDGSGSDPAAQLRAYLDQVLPAYRAAWPGDASFEARLAWQRVLDDGGWAAPGWPMEHGGRALGAADRVQCDAELARADAPMVAGVLGINNVGPTIVGWGTEEQKALLPRILSGEDVWCQGFSEPDAGSDLAALKTRAEQLDGEFVVNGQKVWTSNGMQATHCMLLARTDPAAGKHGGISVLLVPMDLPGIERRPLRQITGESEFAEVFFTDVRVPASALLGPLHDGWRVTMTTLGYERAGVISMAAGLEREVLRTVGNLRGRALDPAVRSALVDRYLDARIVGLLGQRALAQLRAGEQPGPAQSVIKYAWSRASQRLGETVLDAEGAYGLLGGRTGDAGHDFLRSRASTIAAGTTEVMRNILAERVLGLPKG
jgi:alkylation response protein AidB-like acyl-CoA dehydrogenase